MPAAKVVHICITHSKHICSGHVPFPEPHSLEHYKNKTQKKVHICLFCL